MFPKQLHSLLRPFHLYSILLNYLNFNYRSCTPIVGVIVSSNLLFANTRSIMLERFFFQKDSFVPDLDGH